MRTLLLFSVVYFALSHKCIHDEIAKKVQIVAVESDLSLAEAQLELVWRPIKIQFDLTYLRGLTSEACEFIVNDTLPNVQRFFATFMKVKTNGRPITLNGGVCGDIQIPPNTQFDGDLLVFVTNKDEPQEEYLAFASTCRLALAFGNRPIGALVTLNSHIIQPNKEKFLFFLDTFIHEMIHVLGMSKSLFEHFVDSNNRPIPKEKVVKDVVIRGAETSVIILPKVVEWARKHFSCNEIDGVELENQGNAASRGSHWERRIFFNEIMTASSLPRTILSGVTLTLLESTGWYKIDYSATQILQFGLHQGCKFLDTPCIDKKGNPLLEGFCDIKDFMSCTNDHRGRGSCRMTWSQTFVPKHFDYLDDKSTSSDPFMDNCPYTVPFPNSLCHQHELRDHREIVDEDYKPGSKCFDGDYVKKSYGKVKNHTGCHSFECSLDEAGKFQLIINVGSAKVVCPPKGGKVPVPGYLGTINCPIGSLFCSIEYINECSTLNFCSGIGKCWTGHCICPKGLNPHDCSDKKSA